MGSAAPSTLGLHRMALALGAFALAFTLSLARLGHGAPDFYVFWAAARHWHAPYDPAVVAQLEAAIHLKGVWPFVYPPTFVFLVRPFAAAPLWLAYPLWTGLSAAVFAFAASFVVRPSAAVAALIIAPPVFIAGELGQTSLFVGAAMIGGLQLMDRRPGTAGALFALAIAIKPQAMLLAPIVLWGRWRLLGWTALVGLSLATASLALGPERWPEWLRAVSAFRSIAPAAERINPSAVVSAPAWAAICAGLGAWLAWRSKDLAGLVGGTLLVSPYAHAYDLAPLAPAALAWIIERRRLGWGLALAGAALLAGVVASPLAAFVFCGALAAIRTWPAAALLWGGPPARALAGAEAP